jgi:hypothetical protein
MKDRKERGATVTRIISVIIFRRRIRYRSGEVLPSRKLRKFPGLNFHAVFGLIVRSLSLAQTGWNREVAWHQVYGKSTCLRKPYKCLSNLETAPGRNRPNGAYKNAVSPKHWNVENPILQGKPLNEK